MVNPLRALRPNTEEERRRKRHGAFDGYDINKREGEPTEQAMRRVDLGNDIMRRPGPERGEYLTDEPLGVKPVNPLRAALSSDSGEIAPDYRSGGATSSSVNLPELSPMSTSGRPNRNRMLLDRGARESDYQDQLDEYKPQNENIGKTILKSAVGLIGGVGSAASPWLNRTRTDENWRNRELAKSEDRQDRGNALRRAGLQEDYVRSQTAENQAQAEAAARDRTKYDWLPQDTDGDGIPDSETYSPVRPGSSKRVFRKAAAEGNPMVVETKNADGSTARRLSYDHGKTWETAEGLGDAAPIAKPDKPTANYSKRAEWYYKKQSEAEAQAKDFRDKAGKADLETYAGQQAQQDFLKRAGEAEKNAATYRDKGDEAATEPTQSAKGSADPLQGVQWSKSKYRGKKSVEQAAREAEARGAIIVD